MNIQLPISNFQCPKAGRGVNNFENFKNNELRTEKLPTKKIFNQPCVWQVSNAQSHIP